MTTRIEAQIANVAAAMRAAADSGKTLPVEERARQFVEACNAVPDIDAGKLAAQVAALEPLAIHIAAGRKIDSPMPRLQPIETIRAVLVDAELHFQENELRIVELNAECRNLEKRLTRAVVDEAAANTRAARASYLTAEGAVRAAAFDETIARAVLRGKLPATIREDLVEWSKS